MKHGRKRDATKHQSDMVGGFINTDWRCSAGRRAEAQTFVCDGDGNDNGNDIDDCVVRISGAHLRRRHAHQHAFLAINWRVLFGV